MNFRKLTARSSWPALALLALAPFGAPAANALTEHNVPRGVQLSEDLGRVPADKEQKLTITLKLHDQAGFDQAVKNLYDAKSPSFHKWFTDSDFEKYAPTAAEYNTVKQELLKQGFTVLSEDPHRLSIRVHGTTANVEKAFQTQLHTFKYKNNTFQAHVTDAQLSGEAGKLVDGVAGIERHQIHPAVTIANNPRTGAPLFKKPFNTSAGLLTKEITGTPISAPIHSKYTTGGSEPTAIYSGNAYDINPDLVVAYSPAQLQAHYKLPALYSQGYDGTGQTIALVEGYGYDAIQLDANTAATVWGLPKLTAKNFQLIYPEGKPLLPDAGDEEGWTVEIALDVQSAHAIAPGAKIVVLASAGQDDEDQLASIQYVITRKLANVISNSWENAAEIVAGPAEEEAFNRVLEVGVASGVSIQFSSGDGGDLGLETPVGDVDVPSNSPYATAVGGTSILNNPAGGADVVTGWGNDLAYVNLGGPVDPPTSFSFFYAGAGGGESAYWPKPWYQSALPGTGRQVPDVSAVADPFTGFAIIFTDEGTQYLEAGIGGTSLASPIFTATWAIANQYNGASLGNAAYAVSKLKAGEITDVTGTTPLNSTDVTGTVYDASGQHFYSTDALFSEAYPVQTQTEFVSGLWNIVPGEEAIAISFGTDSSLTVTPGWDNVTGYGEPNGLPFIQGVTGKTTGAVVAK